MTVDMADLTVIWIFTSPFLLSLLSLTTGSIITAITGENKLIRWKMDPVAPSTDVVTVLHRNFQDSNADKPYVILFSALGTKITPEDTIMGHRVLNASKTNTGDIEFTLTGITAEDAGEYRTSFSDRDGTLFTSVGVTLVVYVKPSKPTTTIISAPVVGQILTLKCTATSNSKPENQNLPMHYIWYIDGAHLPANDRYEVSNNILFVENIEKNDQDAIYTCKAYETESLLSDVSDGYRTKVRYGPDGASLDTAPQLSVVENRGTLGPVTCSADCVPVCTYKWMFNGALYSFGYTLTVNNIRRTSAGRYRCIAANGYGAASTTDLVVTVGYGPDGASFNTSQQLSLVENRGTLGPVTCRADCVPACTYKWMFDGAEYSLGNTLTVNNIRRTSAGRYRCTASNGYGSASTTDLVVTVEYGPGRVSINTTRRYSLVENQDTLGPIVCTADCVPTCTYQWKLNGKNTGRPGHALTINNIQRESAGTYWCRAHNSHGNERSQSVIVDVTYGPGRVSPIYTPNKYLVENTDTLGPITCSADCKPACTYQWKFSHGNIVRQGDTLTINNIQRTSAGTYWCYASNKYGNKKSGNVVVVVEFAPGNLELRPVKLSYTVLERATLGPVRCSATCKPSCWYQWLHNGEVFSLRSNLYIWDINRNQRGNYSCIARNRLGSQMSQNVSVDVQYGPRYVTLLPNIGSYTLVEKIRDTLGPIVCHADCNPECLYKWTRSNKIIPNQGRNLTIQNVLRDDVGVYRCIASNLGNRYRESIPMKVIVEYKPDIPNLIRSKIGNLAENDTFFLTCTTDGFPLPDINITSIVPHGRHHITHGNVSNTFYIENAGCLDTGKYKCTSTNKIGSSSSREVSVNVACSPRIDDREVTPRNIFLGDKENLNIRVTIIANPRPVLTWMFKLNSSDTAITMKNGTDSFTYYEKTKHVTYTTQAVRSSMGVGDYGIYILGASNSLKETEIVFRVFAKRSPDPPYEARADCYSSSAAAVTWKSNFNGGNRQYFIVSTSTESQDQENKMSDIGNQITDTGIHRLHKAEVQKLKPDTLYYFTVEAHNDNGMSRYSHPLNCTTQPIQEQSGSSLPLIGGAAGGSFALIIIIIIIGVTLFLRSRKQKNDDDKELENVGAVTDGQGPSCPRQVNDPNGSENAVINKPKGETGERTNDVYSVVDKRTTPIEDSSECYAVVQKSSRKGKRLAKNKGHAKDAIYENYGATFKDKFTHVGSSHPQGSSGENRGTNDRTTSRQKNKDGLIYVDVEIVNNGKGLKMNGIHGADKKVEYMDIDFTKRADPLPS